MLVIFALFRLHAEGLTWPGSSCGHHHLLLIHLVVQPRIHQQPILPQTLGLVLETKMMWALSLKSVCSWWEHRF